MCGYGPGEIERIEDMKGHFDEHVKLHQIILERKPKVIVEVGAGEGENTRQLASITEYPFELHVISDKALEGLPANVKWRTGISYKVLKEFADDSIDLCIIDTDHNYWTLAQELVAVLPKMREGGLVVMHDVEEFYYDTGMAMSYWNDEPYPAKEIEEQVKFGGLGLCLIDFLHSFRGAFKLVRWIPERFGCAIIERRTVVGTNVIRPGGSPVFAKPQ